MESHPEEFEFHASGSLAVTGRWETWITQLGWYFNEAEKALIYGKAKELIFQRVHGEVMDELLNGPERRRKEAEEHEYERQMVMQGKLAQQQQQAQQAQQNAYGQYQNQLGQYQNAGVTHIAGAGPSLKAGIAASQPETTLSSSTISQIKKALGL
jgi:hypothetical protein